MATIPPVSSTINSDPPDLGPEARHAHPLGFGRIFGIFLCLLAGIIVIFFLDRLLMPKYASSIFEGSLIAEYYESTMDHDLLIIGDCEVYENISPITLWENYGITSYIRGSPQQLIWQSYYLLEDALRYETPEAVLFSVYGMKYSEPQSEAYNRLTLDGMRFSPSKVAAVRASMTEGESFLSYFLPLLRFHDRWRELSSEDLQYLCSRRGVALGGFMVRCDVKPLGTLPTPQAPASFIFDEICWDYLDKARTICESNGIEFILFKAPVMFPHWFPEWDEQIISYAEAHGLTYINALDVMDDIGLDFELDTYNAGLHLNVWGAEKMADYLGGILVSHGLGEDEHDEETNTIWAQMSDSYNTLKAKQLSEIEEYGKVITLTRE